MKKLIALMALALALTACSEDTDTKDAKQEVKQEEPVQTEMVDENKDQPDQELSPYEEIAQFVFGKDVKCQVIEGWGDDNQPKITRINITDSDQPAVDPFLIDAFSYLKKLKEQGLDYESVFFILKSQKTDGNEYPYVKIEIEKEAADNFDFNTKDPVDLKAIAKTYDAPDAKETSKKGSTKATVSNDNVKAFITGYIKEYFKDDYDISIEEENDTFMVNMYPKDPDLKEAIMTLMLNPTNPQLLDGWNQMSQNFLTVSKSIKEQIDENVSILIYNPLNPEAALLVTINDFIFSDFTKE